jgi:hypothetical protein
MAFGELVRDNRALEANPFLASCKPIPAMAGPNYDIPGELHFSWIEIVAIQAHKFSWSLYLTMP